MAERWQRRLEALGLLLCAVVAVALVVRFGQVAIHRDPAYPAFANPYTLSAAARQVSLGDALLVLLAYVVVTLGPGEVIGRAGVVALRMAVGLGLLVAAITAYGAWTILTGSGSEAPTRAATGGSVPYLAAAAIAAFTAWCAFQALGELVVRRPSERSDDGASEAGAEDGGGPDGDGPADVASDA